VEGSAPSETEEEITNGKLSVIDVGLLTIVGTFAPTDRKTGLWWYTWTGSHLIREPLVKNRLKEGAGYRYHIHVPLEKKKWSYAGRLFGTNSV
jgi:hypothetical protein